MLGPLVPCVYKVLLAQLKRKRESHCHTKGNALLPAISVCLFEPVRFYICVCLYVHESPCVWLSMLANRNVYLFSYTVISHAIVLNTTEGWTPTGGENKMGKRTLKQICLIHTIDSNIIYKAANPTEFLLILLSWSS